MAEIFGLDLRTLLGLSEEERESVSLGYGDQAVVLTTLGPIGVSDLNDQNN